ncbi:MAG: DUF5058 family protein [Oscillospiraceae bacterium]|nr:DUF5058 family protein [Oscillospiraceae bacterium]
MSFRENGLMYALGSLVVGFVILQAVVFLIKAWRRGREIGISVETLKNAVVQSSLFSLGPGLSFSATLLMLSVSMGLVLPWIRLSIIGNIVYETTAAETALNAYGVQTGLAAPVADPVAFAAILWVMTLGCILSLVIIPIFLKKIQKKMGSTLQKRDNKWADAMSAAAFIGIISAFIGRALAGQGNMKMAVPGAGLMSVAALLSSVGVMIFLEQLGERKNSRFLQNFAMPISMYFALVLVVVLAQVLPENIAFFEFRGRV